MAYSWTFGKDPQKQRKFCERFTIKYDMVDYSVTVDLREKCIILKPTKSCPHWLKTTLWKELGRLAQENRIAI